jgi:hypothetical protein
MTPPETLILILGPVAFSTAGQPLLKAGAQGLAALCVLAG